MTPPSEAATRRGEPLSDFLRSLFPPKDAPYKPFDARLKPVDPQDSYVVVSYHYSPHLAQARGKK